MIQCMLIRFKASPKIDLRRSTVECIDNRIGQSCRGGWKLGRSLGCNELAIRFRSVGDRRRIIKKIFEPKESPGT